MFLCQCTVYVVVAVSAVVVVSAAVVVVVSAAVVVVSAVVVVVAAVVVGSVETRLLCGVTLEGLQVKHQDGCQLQHPLVTASQPRPHLHSSSADTDSNCATQHNTRAQ